MVFIWENIPAKLLFTGRALVEAIFVELFLDKKKWLLWFAYITRIKIVYPMTWIC